MRLRRAPAVAVLGFAAVANAGCAAITLPSGPSSEDEDLVAAHAPSGLCAVVAAASVDDRDEFAEQLRSTGLFSDVVSAEAGAVPTNVEWIVGLESAPYIEPSNRVCSDGRELLTILTLGVVPTIRTRSATRVIRIASVADGAATPRAVSVGGDVTGIDGWLALPLHLMPWCFRSSGASVRTRLDARNFAAAICRTGTLDRPSGAR